MALLAPPVVESAPAPQLGAFFDGAPLLPALDIGEPRIPLVPLHAAPVPAPLPAAPLALPTAPRPAWGEFTNRTDWGFIIMAVCTAGFFAGALTHGMPGLLFMAMLVATLFGMGLEGRVKTFNRQKPLARANERVIRAASQHVPGSAWFARAVQPEYRERQGAYAAALLAPPAALGALLDALSMAVESETTYDNVRAAYKALAHAGPPAVPYLQALRSRAPHWVHTELDAAIASASALPAAAAAAQAAALPTPAAARPRFDEAAARARRVLEESPRDTLPRSVHARVLEEELRMLDAALAAGDEAKAAVSLARLEALLK
jgi:hypothetical protein